MDSRVAKARRASEASWVLLAWTDQKEIRAGPATRGTRASTAAPVLTCSPQSRGCRRRGTTSPRTPSYSSRVNPASQGRQGRRVRRALRGCRGTMGARDPRVRPAHPGPVVWPAHSGPSARPAPSDLQDTKATKETRESVGSRRR